MKSGLYAKKIGRDCECLVLNYANNIPGVSARLATPEEDCGYHKADVVMVAQGVDHYIQVSLREKSKKQRKNLLRRGTIPIHLSRDGINIEEGRIRRELADLISSME